MGHTRNATLAISACLGLLAACDAHQLAPTPGDRAPERSLARDLIVETFRSDGEHLVSPVLQAPLGATRVAMMLDTTAAAAQAVSFEARGLRSDGSAGEWLPLELRWEEHPAYVLRVDLGEAFSAAELRLAAGDIDDVEWLLWSAFVPSPEADAALQSGELDVDVRHGPELHEPGLAAQPLLGGVQPRSAWGARSPVCTSTDSNKGRISIHHTVTPRTSNGSYEQRIRGIQNFHIDGRGWCDIGYHVMVTADGRLWQARPENRLGTHVGGQNTGNLGVSLVGCFNSSGCANMGGTTAPAAMIDATSQIVRTAADAFNISISSSTVMGHRDNPGQSTSCPGSDVHGKLGQIRTAAINGGTETATTGRLIGTVWDVSITTDVSQSLAMDARLPGATVTTQSGQQVTAPSGEAIWQMNVAPGTYTVTAAKSGYESASSTVTVTAGADTWASIGLTPTATTGRAIGTVWDLSITADPSQSAALDARLAGAKVRASNGAEATVPEGDAIWELDLPTGTHTLTASLDGFEDATRQVTITAGGDSWASMGMQPVANTADLTVVVFDSEGGPSAVVEDASVTISGAGQHSTDADGRATTTVGAGDVTVRVEAEGYQAMERVVTVVAGEPLVEEIGLTAAAEDDEEDLEAAEAFVTFIVFDLESGDAVQEASVRVEGASPVVTDEDGRASLSLPPGTVVAQVTGAGYLPTELSLTLEPGAVLFEEVGLSLDDSVDGDVDLGQGGEQGDVGRVALPAQAEGDEVVLGSCAQASGSAPPLAALILCVAILRRRRHA